MPPTLLPPATPDCSDTGPQAVWQHGVCSHDVDELAAGQPQWSLQYTQLSRGAFLGQAQIVQLPGVRLVRERATRAVWQRGALGQDHIGLALPLALPGHGSFNGQPLAPDSLMLGLAAMTGMVSDMTANRDTLKAAAASGFSTATDLADWLVRSLNLPFREAHHVTGTLVAMAETRGCDLPDLSLPEMNSVHPGITQEIYSVLGVENSVRSRTSYGGTSPEQVRAQIARWRDNLK